jgi:hypothetical protein
LKAFPHLILTEYRQVGQFKLYSILLENDSCIDLLLRDIHSSNEREAVLSYIEYLEWQRSSIKLVTKNDAPRPWQCGFQDSGSIGMDSIVDLHHEIMFYVILISIFVL